MTPSLFYLHASLVFMIKIVVEIVEFCFGFCVSP